MSGTISFSLVGLVWEHFVWEHVCCLWSGQCERRGLHRFRYVWGPGGGWCGWFRRWSRWVSIQGVLVKRQLLDGPAQVGDEWWNGQGMASGCGSCSLEKDVGIPGEHQRHSGHIHTCPDLQVRDLTFDISTYLEYYHHSSFVFQVLNRIVWDYGQDSK